MYYAASGGQKFRRERASDGLPIGVQVGNGRLSAAKYQVIANRPRHQKTRAPWPSALYNHDRLTVSVRLEPPYRVLSRQTGRKPAIAPEQPSETFHPANRVISR